MFAPYELESLILYFGLPLTRISAMLMVMPIFGAQFVPKRVKLLLSFGISLIVFPLLYDNAPIAQNALNSLQLIYLLIKQIVIGVMIGLAVHVVFQAFVMAAELCAMQMGLGFASMVDPQNGLSVPALGQFYLMIVTLLFLSMNGHLFLIQTIVESFDKIPVSIMSTKFIDFSDMVTLGSWIFLGGLKIALPAVTALLIVNMAIGIMTKATPQLNIFSLGFPVTMILGMIILWFSSVTLLPQFTEMFNELIVKINQWIV